MTIAAAFAAVAATTVAVPEPAAAAGPCGSSYAHVGHYEFGPSATKDWGAIDVYWSSTAGRNCAVMNSTGDAYGVSGRKFVRIFPTSAPKYHDYDSGNYKYYAGPVYTPRGYNMSGKCITVEAGIWLSSGDAGLKLPGIHCG